MADDCLSLCVIVLNYRTPELTIACAASLEHEVSAERGGRVLIVDNHSDDGSAELIAKAIAERGWETWAELVRSPVNGGFAAGNNVGVRHARADTYLLLNSDTVVRPGTLDTLAQVLKDRPGVGLVGPRLESVSGEEQVSCFRAPTPLSELQSAARTGVLRRLLNRWVVSDPTAIDVSRCPDWISFACVLIRREVFEQVGPLDEGYFMYFEDSDFCRKATDAGWEIAYCTAAGVMHVGEASDPGKAAGKTRRRPPYFYASRARYYRRFYGRRGLLAANVLWTVGRSLAAGRELLGRPQGTTPLDRREIWRHW